MRYKLALWYTLPRAIKVVSNTVAELYKFIVRKSHRVNLRINLISKLRSSWGGPESLIKTKIFITNWELPSRSISFSFPSSLLAFYGQSKLCGTDSVRSAYLNWSRTLLWHVIQFYKITSISIIRVLTYPGQLTGTSDVTIMLLECNLIDIRVVYRDGPTRDLYQR